MTHMKLIVLALSVFTYADIAHASCAGSSNYQQCAYNEMMGNTGGNSQQTITSRPNPQGGYDYSNGATSRANPQGGYDYSNGTTCRRNPFGGLDCR